MSKRILAAFVLVLACVLAFTLAACNDDTPAGEQHKHTYSSEWSFDETSHWHAATCEHTDEVADRASHVFDGNTCSVCGYQKADTPTEPDDDTLLDGEELKNVAISPQGLLTWSRLRIASKYSLTVSFPEGEKTYEIAKSEGSFDLSRLPDGNKLRYGKNSLTLTVYRYEEEEIGGETVGANIPVSDDTFIAVNKNDGFSLVRTTYADEYITIDGAYSDMREDAYGKDYILIDKEIPQGKDDVSFNLSSFVTPAAGVTVKFYKTEQDRTDGTNEVTGFNNWLAEVVRPGDNRYFLRAITANGSIEDYTVNICGVRYITFYFLTFDRSGVDENGLNLYSYTSVTGSTVLLENDYLDIDSLYAMTEGDKVIVDNKLNIFERGKDYTVPFVGAPSKSFSLFCADRSFIEAQAAEAALYKDIFEMTYGGFVDGRGNTWTLTFKADSTETSIVVPSSVYGDKVALTSNSFRGASELRSVIFADGFTSLPDRLFANGCSSLTDVTIPASVTSHYSLGDWMFSEDLKDQLTIYCEGDIESDTWNRVPNQMAFFRTLTNQAGAASTVTVNGARIKVDAAANTAEVLSASGENVVIPDTVRFGAKYYPVTSVKENAAIGAATVTLGKNIASLGTGWAADTVKSVQVADGNANFATASGILYAKDGWTFAFVPKELTGEITIPDGVTDIPADILRGRNGITAVILPDTLLSVGKGAFAGCEGIESITLPFVGEKADGSGATHFGYIFGANSDSYNSQYVPSSLVRVTLTGDALYAYAFYGCDHIESVTLPEGLTVIPQSAFNGCTALSSVNIPTSVTEIGDDAFSSCSSLKTVEYYGTGRVATIAFRFCTALEKIVFPNISYFDTSFYVPFDGCTSLVAAEVPANVISSLPDTVLTLTVTKGELNSLSLYSDNEWIDRTTLETVIISADVTRVAVGAFDGCANLETVTIDPDNTFCFGDGKIVVTRDGALIYAVSAAELTLPESVKTISSFGEDIAAVLKELRLPASLTALDIGLFDTFTQLTTIGVSEANPVYYAEGNCLVQKDDRTVVLGGCDATLPDDVVSIGSYAFAGRGITSIAIPDNVLRIEHRAFENCAALTSVILNDTLEYLGECAFIGCDALNYTEHGGARYLGSADNTYMLLAEGGASAEIHPATRMIGPMAFMSAKMRSVVIPDSVKIIGGSAFAGTNLIRVTIGSGVTEIASGAFEGCTGLIEVYNRSALPITEGSSDFGKVAYYAEHVYTDENEESILTETEDGFIFYDDGNVVTLIGYTGTAAELTLPDNFEGKSYTIGERAFSSLTQLKKVVIGDGVTSIGESAFYGCGELAWVEIGDNVTEIGDYAFAVCYNIVKLTVGSKVTDIPRNALNSNKLVEVCNRSSLDMTPNTGDYWFVAYKALNLYTPSDGESKLDVTEDGYIFYADGETVYLVGYMGTDTEIVLPDSYNGKPYSVYQHAFNYMTSLTSLKIPAGVTIGREAFSYCTSLTDIEILTGVTIENYAFLNCTSLEHLKVDVSSFDPSDFHGATSLVSLTIGTNVKSLWNLSGGSINYLPALKEINYEGTIAQWESVSKYDEWNKYTVHCTDGDIIPAN